MLLLHAFFYLRLGRSGYLLRFRLGSFFLLLRSGHRNTSSVPFACTRHNDNRGQTDMYTEGNTDSYGTYGMLTSLLDVRPGTAVHGSPSDTAKKSFYSYSKGSAFGTWKVKISPLPRGTCSTQNLEEAR
ncbi:MAG: hypothetical protein WA952_03375, partial [Lewinella sp.]